MGRRGGDKCQCNGSGTALSAQRDGGRRLNRPEKKSKIKSRQYCKCNLINGLYTTTLFSLVDRGSRWPFHRIWLNPVEKPSS